MWGHSEKTAIYEPGSGPSLDIESAGVLILDFLASRIVRNTFLLFINYLVNGIFVKTQQTKTYILVLKQC